MRSLAILVLVGLVLGGCGRREEAPRVRQVSGGTPELGRVAFQKYGCGGCHRIPGVPQADGRVAPPLTDFADRAYVAGVVPNEPDALVKWIVDPHEVNPGTAMPDLAVTEADARHMAAYLYTLEADRR